MKPEQLRQARRREKLIGQARSARLEEYLRNGGDPDVVRPELVPSVADQTRLEREIRALAVKAAKHPKGKARNRKLDQVIGLVAELCVVERVLALEPLQRASLRPSQLATMAHSSQEELYGKLHELVAGVVGGGTAPKVEISR